MSDDRKITVCSACLQFAKAAEVIDLKDMDAGVKAFVAVEKDSLWRGMDTISGLRALCWSLTIGDFRRARQALAGAGEVASTAAFKNTDDAKPVDVIEAVLHCASSWDGNARIIGNVRAKDIIRALLATSAGLCEQAITIEKLRRAAVVETPELVEKVARAICREKCAYCGEPPCFEIRDDQGQRMPWPNPNCDEPGCQSEARAAIRALAPIAEDGK